jgi:hypothetical protein
MALMKVWSGGRFRTRDPQRDAATDAQRLLQVREAVLAALDAVRRERDGLQRRVDRDYGRAASLLDEAADYESRPAAEEAEIAEAERHAGAALTRVEGLAGQIALFEHLLSELDEAIAEQDVATSA